MSNKAHAVASCTSELAGYLRTNVSGLTVREEWPRANEKLALPSATLFVGKITTTNCQPEFVAKTAPDVNNQIVITEIIGRHDFKMQLDLWCASKLDRDTYLGLVMDALNKNTATAQGEAHSSGLNLQLATYFNDWVRYDIDGFQYVDDEAAAQRQERRVRLDLLVNCRAIRQRTVYAMVKLDINVGAVDIVATMPDDLTGTEVREI